MGGKRVSGGTNSEETMHPRISSAGSSKGSPIDSTSVPQFFYSKRESFPLNKDVDDEDDEGVSHEAPSLDLHRKNSFDIISLLENQEDVSGNEQARSKRSENSSELPSFWHFVEPNTRSHDIFQHPMYQHNHHHPKKDMRLSSVKHHEDRDNDAIRSTKKSADPKRALKRRKMKKVQSAKVAGFKGLERSSERLKTKGHEWLRVLTPPGTGSSSLDSANNDSEDELIRRYFSGLSSAGSSISWAEDAMESEFTTQLLKLWEAIEAVCGGGSRPEKMSDAVYDECMQWRKAFPNPDLHRFSSGFRNDGELSSVASPTLEEEQGDVDTIFSSLVQSSSPSSFNEGRKGSEDNISLLQANFRALNCSTPRPNIEKSTEYVSAWLSECQNSHVPDGTRPISSDVKNTRAYPMSNPNQNPDLEMENGGSRNRHSLRLVSDIARSSYSHYSRSHAKFINEPDPTNFFTSLAITNNGSYNPLESKSNTFGSSSISTMGADIHNETFVLPRINGTNNGYHSRINESDEEDDDGSSTPTEIVSFRPNVRVQRPISSRIRDHAITPIATGSYVHSSFGGRHQAINLNKQATAAAGSLASNPYQSENYRGGRFRMFESLNTSTNPMSATADRGSSSTTSRIKSGMVRQGHGVTLATQLGRSKQQPWSRHSGDDLTAEANYVTSLYENYPSSMGTRNIEEGVNDANSANSEGPNHCSSPSFVKSSHLYYDRSRGIDGPHSIAECEEQPFKPAVSWLRNH